MVLVEVRIVGVFYLEFILRFIDTELLSDLQLSYHVNLIFSYHLTDLLGRFRDFKNEQQIFLSYLFFYHTTHKFGHSSARTETNIPRHITLLLFSNIRSFLRELSWWRTYHIEVNKHSSSSSHHGEALNHFSPKQWAVVGREGRFGHNHPSSLFPPLARGHYTSCPPVKWENLCNVEILTWQVTFLTYSTTQIFSSSDHVGRDWRKSSWN